MESEKIKNLKWNNDDNSKSFDLSVIWKYEFKKIYRENNNKKIIFESLNIDLSLFKKIKNIILNNTKNSVKAIPIIKDTGIKNNNIFKFSFLTKKVMQ